MNIEQKNTLFVISLVLAVLLGVTGAAFLLVRDHVAAGIHGDLDRASKVFVSAQKNTFENLFSVARSVRSEPSLIAASLTGDIATVRGMLDDLYPRPGADFIAVYLDTGPGDVAGVGDKPHFTSSQVLGSADLLNLVRDLKTGDAVEFGNTLMFDSLLQLVAVPIQNPLGGRVGALIVGKRFSTKDLQALRELVYADIALFSDNVVLASSIPGLKTQLPMIKMIKSSQSGEVLDVGSERYSVRVLPVLSRAGSDRKAAKVLLAVPHSSYWAPFQVLGGNALYFSALILLLAGLFGIIISRRTLTRPIQLLARATQAIANGDMTQKIKLAR